MDYNWNQCLQLRFDETGLKIWISIFHLKKWWYIFICGFYTIYLKAVVASQSTSFAFKGISIIIYVSSPVMNSVYQYG